MDLERLKRRNENCAKGREVLEMLRTKQEELIEGQRSELAETVRESGEVFSQAESTTELRIDTEIGLAISQIHVKRVQRIATSFESVTLQDFVACIAQMVHTTHDRQTNATTRPSSSQRGQPDGWARLGAQHTRMISCGPRFASFLRAITKEEEGNPTEKKRRVRNAAATLPQAQQITITANVDNDDEQREGSELSKRTGYLKKILHQLQRVALPQFVIDPESYINTVENLFHLSFLIRQGVAEIVVEDGASILVYKHLDGNASIDASDLTFKQAVIRLDYETWEEMASKYPRRVLDPWMPSERYLNQIGMTLEDLQELCSPLTPNSKARVLGTYASRYPPQAQSRGAEQPQSSNRNPRVMQTAQRSQINIDSGDDD